LLLDSGKLKSRYKLSIVSQQPEGHQTSTIQDPNLSETAMVFTSISQQTRDDILARAGVAQKTNFLKRMWWAAVDKEKIVRLVADVQSLVRELWNLLDPLWKDDVRDSLISVSANMLKMNKGFEQLDSIKEALKALLEGSRSTTEKDLKGLITTAELKALQAVLVQDGDRKDSVVEVSKPRRQEILKKLERLSRQKLSSFTPLKKNDTMGTGVYEGESVFIEWKQLNPAFRSKVLPRAENLAALLSIPKDETFQSLTCRGLLEDDQRLGFVYQYPSLSHSPGEPRSLLELFSAKDGIEPPSLSDRMRLALRIAQVVRNFHQTGWLHKGLRSENILFFNTKDVTAAVRSTDFVLGGFNFARFGAPTEISEQPSADPKHDIYRHPSALGQPAVSFDESMDAYSLGTILLEIAEWRALQYLLDSVVDVRAESVPLDRIAAVRQHLLSGKGKGGTSKLRTKMGDVYTSVCVMCLSGKFDDTEGDDLSEGKGQESLVNRAVRQLQSCRV
jgi:hypothetical protein